MVFSCFWGQKNFKKFFCKRHFMQLVSADARVLLKKIWDFFLPLKTWKNCPQKLPKLIFFQYCQPAQNLPKSNFLFHKNVSLRDFYIMTLSVIHRGSDSVVSPRSLFSIELCTYISDFLPSFQSYRVQWPRSDRFFGLFWLR